MKPGTWIEMADGTKGTVVYNGLDGRGIRYGHFDLSEEQIDCLKNSNPLFRGSEDASPVELGLRPEAMLRGPYPSADCDCIGDEFEVVREGISLH